MKTTKLDYQNGNIGKLFRSLFFPTLIGMLSNSVFLITDGIFVGQGIGPLGLAAVNMVAPMFILICGITLMFGIGSSVGASICLASKQHLSAKKIVFQCFLSGELLILFLATIFISDPKGIVNILGADDSIRKLSSAYLFWLFTAMICMLPQIGGMMVMRLDGSPKYAMFCQLIPAILNIALDYYLIFQLKLETTGAALATSISGIVGALMVFLYFCKWSVNFRFTKITDAFEGILTNTRYAVKIGFSAFFTEATTCVMMLTGNYMFMRLIGIEGVSAYSIVCYLFPVFFSFANSIIQSEQPIISFNYGNQAYGRIAATFQQAIGTAFLSGIGLSLCCLLFNRPIAEIFLGNGMEYGLAEAGIPLFAICPIFFISNMAVIGYYQSIEKACLAGHTCGIIFRNDKEQTLYLAGDTIWYHGVETTLDKYSPEVILINAGGNKFKGFRPVIMHEKDVLEVHRHMPKSILVATHLEGVNHNTVTRKELCKFAETNDFSDKLLIPDDGQTISL